MASWSAADVTTGNLWRRSELTFITSPFGVTSAKLFMIEYELPNFECGMFEKYRWESTWNLVRTCWFFLLKSCCSLRTYIIRLMHGCAPPYMPKVEDHIHSNNNEPMNLKWQMNVNSLLMLVEADQAVGNAFGRWDLHWRARSLQKSLRNLCLCQTECSMVPTSRKLRRDGIVKVAFSLLNGSKGSDLLQITSLQREGFQWSYQVYKKVSSSAKF